MQGKIATCEKEVVIDDTRVLLKESELNGFQKVNFHRKLSRACVVFYKTRPITIARDFIFPVFSCISCANLFKFVKYQCPHNSGIKENKTKTSLYNET